MRSLQITICGPDPQLKIHRSHKLSSITQSGTTSIGGSGLLCRNLILTHVLPLLPFLDLPSKSLIYRAKITATIEGLQDPVECDLLRVEFVDRVNEAIEEICKPDSAEWVFGFGAKQSRSYVGGVAILRVKECEEEKLNRIKGGFSLNVGELVKGQDVRVISSPFGLQAANIFLNTVSHGVTANIIKDKGGNVVLAMTDAKCLPGAEGAMVVAGGGVVGR
ncbi:hypothetical protein HDV05_000655 [Chytridiales sp. JEL 0842]|nr:hypothetical protein HDV05_000655 [Chytridiales sp. JEL 0842]